MKFLERHFGGHWSCGPLTVYGFNAMHVAVSLWTRRWGYVCFHPTVRCFGHWWRWYFYVSPNATPWASTFAIGPGVYDEERAKASMRRRALGHNFDDEACRDELARIKAIPYPWTNSAPAPESFPCDAPSPP